MDINLDDFVQRVNSDLVGKIVNIASRCAGFVNKQFDGLLSNSLDDQGLWQETIGQADQVAAWYEKDETSRVVREVSRLADLANQYIAEHAPWKLIKEEDQRDKVQDVCSMGLNLFRVLILYLKPILPKTAAEAETFLGIESAAWDDLGKPLLDHRINPFKPLFTRLERSTLDQLIDASREPESSAEQTEPVAEQPTDRTIGIDDFAKVELKVARIARAELVDGADKLLKLTLDLGDSQREVFSGIRLAYDPADLVGELTVVVANLAPRKMRFGVSEGMVLAAGPGGEDIFLIKPDSGAVPGMVVR
jgi:methionyl-tRNA synthetase